MNLAAPAAPLDVARTELLRLGVGVVALPGGLWRVMGRNGEMIGHVEMIEEEGGRRFRSKRFSVRDRRFRVLGEFSNPADAVDAVRFA